MKNKNKPPMFSIKYLAHDIVKVLCFLLGLPMFLYQRPKILFENKKAQKHIRGGAILIANHLGFFDPIYMMIAIWYRRHHFICLKKFFEGKSRPFFKAFLCLPIDKNNVSFGSFREIVEHIKQGELVSMFPEGAVNDGSGETATFKSGVTLMAFQGKVPIVPMYIKKKEHWYERLTMVIGEPIDDFSNPEAKMNFGLIDKITEKLQNKESELEALVKREKNK